MRALYPPFALFVALALLLSACQPATPTATPSPVPTATPMATATPKGTADLVLTNGYIYTVDAKRTVAEAMAVKGDTIVYVGDNSGVQKWIGKNTRVIDLKGKMVLPGLVDSHNHATDAVSEIYEVSLYGLGSVDEIKQAIHDFVAGRPGLQGLKGAGWINAVFGPHGPTKDLLDGIVPNIPAVLASEDFHSVWVNSKALELAGVTKDTPDPKGGIIERDADGNPSGTLRESAADLVADVIPGYTVDQVVEGLKYFQDMAHSYGMTTVYIPSSDETTLKALHALEQSGEMTVRFPTALNVEPQDDLSVVDKLAQVREQEQGGNFWIAGAKLFMDGVL